MHRAWALQKIRSHLTPELRQPLASTAPIKSSSYFKLDLAFDKRYLSHTTSEKQLLHFCVVGSGPAGFYIVSQLLKRFADRVRVSILERLPTPYGLVRSGVAPDHPETKNVINQFSQLGQDERVRFFGNVNVGADIPLSRLRALFHGVVLAYGAESNKVLNMPGRHLEGVYPAREFVWWYNGHPDYAHVPINLKEVSQVSILGLGNVALDCARVLLQPAARLQCTDIAEHALSQLKESNVQRVNVIGRRGPAQAAFTAKELREVLNMEGIKVVLPKEDIVLTEADTKDLKASRSRKRVFELLQTAAKTEETRPGNENAKELHLKFFRSPVEVLPDGMGRIRSVRLEKTQCQMDGQKQIAVPTGEHEDLESDMLLESIGYRSIPMPGAPFDEKLGTIPHRQGRVLETANTEAAHLPGLYVAGWVKRGPSGIIGTNLVDATETVNAIAEDVQNGSLGNVGGPQEPWPELQDELLHQGVQVVEFQHWLQIDSAEVERGKELGKDRQKYTNVSDMLDLCSSGAG